MTSDEINEALSNWGTTGLEVGLIGLGIAPEAEIEAPLCPYLGWYWRSVDWDDFVINGYHFSQPRSNEFFFDEARKWDYPTKSKSAEECANIRAKVERAIMSRSPEDIRAVWMLLGVENSLGKP